MKITKWMRAGAAALGAVLLMPALAASAADRPEDAKIFADFEGSGQLTAGSKIPGNTADNNEAWLNFANDVELSLEDGAMKVVFKRDGNIGMGNPTVYFADADGNPQYKYLVIRMKGANGNENRTEGGGFLLSIGGGEGSHSRSLNDREVGTAPPAVGPDGEFIPPITTEYQNFVIPLTKENVRQASSSAYSLNINCVANEATLYIEDIYVCDTLPSSVATNPVTQAPTEAPATTVPSADNTTAPSNDTTAAETTASATDEAPTATQPSDNTTTSSSVTPTAPTGTAGTTAGAEDQSGGLGTGGAIAISIGVAVVVGGILAAVYFLVIRKKIFH